MKLIAHRGESHLAPENTLSAIDLAWQLGDEIVEIDIHLTTDKRLILSHDATTTRTAGVNLTVSETDSAELAKLDVGKWKGESFVGERMPLLDDVLASLPPGKRLFIEIKSGPETAPYLKKVIHQHAKRSRVTVIGFDLETVSRFKEIAPSIPVYWLLWSGEPYDPKLIDIALERRLDGLNVNSNRLDKAFADAVKAKGLKLYVWTVDDPNEARRLMGLGVDGLTTNRAAWMKEQLGL